MPVAISAPPLPAKPSRTWAQDWSSYRSIKILHFPPPPPPSERYPPPSRDSEEDGGWLRYFSIKIWEGYFWGCYSCYFWEGGAPVKTGGRLLLLVRMSIKIVRLPPLPAEPSRA